MTSEEAQAFLKRIQEAVDKVIEETSGAEEVFYYLVIRHPKSHMTIHTGTACPVCSIAASVAWMIENKIQHEDSDEIVDYPTEDVTKH